MGSDRPKSACMFAGQCDEKSASSDMRSDKTFDRVHSLSVHLSLEIKRSHRRNSSPLTEGFATKHLVVKLDLMRSFDDGRGPLIRTGHITGGMFIGSGKDIDTRVIRVTPRFLQPEEIMLIAFP